MPKKKRKQVTQTEICDAVQVLRRYKQDIEQFVKQENVNVTQFDAVFCKVREIEYVVETIQQVKDDLVDLYDAVSEYICMRSEQLNEGPTCE